jgi:hypothetical protein
MSDELPASLRPEGGLVLARPSSGGPSIRPSSNLAQATGGVGSVGVVMWRLPDRPVGGHRGPAHLIHIDVAHPIHMKEDS